MLEVAQPAVGEPSRPGRHAAADVVLLRCKNPQSARGGIPRNPQTVDPGADDDHVEWGGWIVHRSDSFLAAQAWHILSCVEF
jgi:hypothetical protein